MNRRFDICNLLEWKIQEPAIIDLEKNDDDTSQIVFSERKSFKLIPSQEGKAPYSTDIPDRFFMTIV